MKSIFIISLVIPAAIGQTGTASIAGTVLDAKTQKPIPAALVMAVRSGLPPLSKNTRSGGDGAFQIQDLAPGKYALCVQAPGHGYLDPCQWNGSPTTVTLLSGQAAPGVFLRLTAASVLNIQVQDAQKVLSQKTKDGRRPDLTLGVWGPNGLYYPAHASGSPSAAGDLYSGIAYQMAVPRDIALKFRIASRDLRLGDSAGVALPGNAYEETFQHATGDPNPKSFAFILLGLLP
ncbi:MAG: carboxypeptidase-like regulatory domain-containing protein [Acidobacteriota bacterium]